MHVRRVVGNRAAVEVGQASAGGVQDRFRRGGVPELGAAAGMEVEVADARADLADLQADAPGTATNMPQ